jgi:ATP-binding cassette subfamily B protein
MERLRPHFSNIWWGLKKTWEINRATVVAWSLISLAGAFIPAVFVSLVRDTVNAVQGQIEAGGDYSLIIRSIITLCAFQFAYMMYRIIPNLSTFSMHSKYGIGMQKKMAKLVRFIPIRAFDDAEMSARLHVAMPLIKRLAWFLSNFIDLLSNTASIIILLMLAASESMVFLAVGAVMVAVSVYIGIRNAMQHHKLRRDEELNERLSDYYYDITFSRDTAKEFRLFGMGDFMRKGWLDVAKPFTEKFIKMDDKTSMRWNINGFATLLMRFGVMATALYLIYSGHMNLGGLVLFITLFAQLSGQAADYGWRFSSCFSQTQDIGVVRKALDGDYAVPAIQDEGEPDKTAEPPFFEAVNLSYQYIPEKYALRNISVKINRGEVVALVGGNGSGKSTLVKLLLGLYTPTAGSLYFKGQRYKDIDFLDFVKQTGVTFQDYAKFEFSIRDNIAYGDLSQIHNDDAIMDAVKKGGAEKIISRLEDGVDSLIGRWYKEKGTELSGGEWQRIAVCRALISNRQIMILDEPAAMLDPIAEMEQFDGIRRSAEGRTAILISHRIGFARLADKIIVLDEGNLIESGTHEELIALGGVYNKMFMGQSEWYSRGGDKS